MKATINPYLDLFPNSPPTPNAIFNIYQGALVARLSSNEIQPFLVPQFFTSYGLLIAYLLIPHTRRPWLYHARWLVLACILWREIGLPALGGGLLWRVTTLSLGSGFGPGLVSAWCVVWSVVWLALEDPQRTAKRVERRPRVVGKKLKEDETEKETAETSALSLNGDGEARQRHMDDHAQNGNENGNGKPNENGGKTITAAKHSDEKWEYFWQPYPEDDFLTRVEWVGDLVLSFRGPGWNWEIPTNPGLPPYIKESLGLPIDAKSIKGVSSAGIKRFSSRPELARYVIPRVVCGYVALDILKVFLMKDPFFIVGPNDYNAPPHLAWLHPAALTLFRKILSCTSIIVAVQTIFLLSPLAFCLIIGPKYLGLRGEACMYPTTWGPFSMIYEKGLAGLWGSWWHQTFRKGFSAPTEFLIRHKYIKPKSFSTKLIGLLFAFSISGAMHAAGSVSMFTPSKPFDLMLFFLLQGVGIMVESALATLLKPVSKKTPSWLKKVINFVFAFTWICSTASLIVNDFARGIWLIEPVPFSFVRALGFGYPGEDFFVRFDAYNLGFRMGKHWWDTGFTI